MHNDIQSHLLKVTSHRQEQPNVNEYKLEGRESASALCDLQHRHDQLHYLTSPIVYTELFDTVNSRDILSF